ncbi:hypothetical protein VNI00_014177 [Paramarasmius palmivorus]|uniref:EF-hand domain-containing protein n=1 Tax=Paramarasmius palmivorus TaxID=297713 RepID=A0AAW0BU70_9AGAR
MLQTDLQTLLDDKKQVMIEKLDQVTITITTKMDENHGEIMRKLNSGPHNLIENEEFRTLWQHHPAIGDAIDDDGSGYISVREFNKFLEQKPESWTVPELFAFWALGWQESIYNQTREINDVEWELEKIATQIKKTTKDEAIKEQIKAYLEVLDALTDVTNWYRITSYEDPDEEYGDEEMQKLKEEYNETNQKFFEKIVGNDGIVMDTESSLYELGTKFDTRVELWFIPLIYHVLRLQLKQLNGSSPKTGDSDQSGSDTETEDGDVNKGTENREIRDIPALHITDDGWYDMCCTLEELLLEFHSRMKTLLRGWRMQRLHPELHINSFSGGIFAGWFEVYADGSKKDFITRLESIYSDDDDYSDDDYDDEDEDAEEDGEKEEEENVAKALSKLWKQMSSLQASMKDLQEMMQSIIKGSGARASDVQRHDEDENPEEGNGGEYNREEDGDDGEGDV